MVLKITEAFSTLIQVIIEGVETPAVASAPSCCFLSWAPSCVNRVYKVARRLQIPETQRGEQSEGQPLQTPLRQLPVAHRVELWQATRGSESLRLCPCKKCRRGGHKQQKKMLVVFYMDKTTRGRPLVLCC